MPTRGAGALDDCAAVLSHTGGSVSAFVASHALALASNALVSVGLCPIMRPALDSHALLVALVDDGLRQRRAVIVVERHDIESVGPACLRVQLRRPIVLVIGEGRCDLGRVVAVIEIALEHHHVDVPPDCIGVLLVIRIEEEQPPVGHENPGRIVRADALDQALHPRRRPLVGRPAPVVGSAHVKRVEKHAVASQPFPHVRCH